MIKCKDDLKRYIRQDSRACKRETEKPRIFGDDIWKFQLSLRNVEYYYRASRTKWETILETPARCLAAFTYHHWSVKLQFSIPMNTFQEGLSIAHYGCLVVNGKARIGKNCRIHEGVNIGATNGTSDSPVIGDNVFIGTGAKIIGGIHIADNVAIGANAVVVRDIDEPGTTWAGVPAKKVSNNSSRAYISPLVW